MLVIYVVAVRDETGDVVHGTIIMSDKQLVSVIMIFLNAERFIQESIDSVFAQTYDQWELLLVDDGSTDKSTELAQRYAEQYPQKVRYLEHDGHRNRGMSASRNLGIKHARGVFIAFIDSDDIWLPHKLEQQVQILNSMPEASLVYGAIEYWYSWTGNSADAKRDTIARPVVKPGTLVKPPTLLTLAYPLGKGSTPCPSDLLFRADLVGRTGGFEEQFTGMYEDQAFLSKVNLSESVYIASDHWVRYRQHPDSCVSTVRNAGKYHAMRLYFLQWLTHFLTAKGVNDSAIWKAVHTALWPYKHPWLNKLVKTQHTMRRKGKELTLRAARRVLPSPTRQRILALVRPTAEPPVGRVRFGNLRRLEPISRSGGWNRGQPIDRYYIENFLAQHQVDIRGHVLEIGDDIYTRKFGADRVSANDVLHVNVDNPKATIVADLAHGEHLASDQYDCIILTQTLQYIYDLQAAVQTITRILKPGGTLLATFPAISQISPDPWANSWCWRFTSQSIRLLFADVFTASAIQIECHGNVLAATSFLQGLAAQELRQEELDYIDPHFAVLITLKAVKSEVKP